MVDPKWPKLREDTDRQFDEAIEKHRKENERLQQEREARLAHIKELLKRYENGKESK